MKINYSSTKITYDGILYRILEITRTVLISKEIQEKYPFTWQHRKLISIKLISMVTQDPGGTKPKWFGVCWIKIN